MYLKLQLDDSRSLSFVGAIDWYSGEKLLMRCYYMAEAHAVSREVFFNTMMELYKNTEHESQILALMLGA